MLAMGRIELNTNRRFKDTVVAIKGSEKLKREWVALSQGGD